MNAEYSYHFYSELAGIAFDTAREPADLIFRMRLLAEELLKKYTNSESHILHDNAARLIELKRRYEVPDELIERAHAFRKYANMVMHEKNAECSFAEVENAVKVWYDVAQFLFGNKNSAPSELAQWCEAVPFRDFPAAERKKNLKTEVIVILMTVEKVSEVKKNKKDVPFFEVEGLTDLSGFEHLQRIKVVVTDISFDNGDLTHYGGVYSEMQPLFYPGISVCFFYLKRNSEEETLFFTYDKTLIITEPDNLISVTDLSACVQWKGDFLTSGDLLRKLNPSAASQPMVIGNIINETLDRYFSSPELAFDEIFEDALKNQALALRSLLKKDGKMPVQIKMEIRDTVLRHETNLRNFRKEFETGHRALIEPTFYAPSYGLQGRADLMIQSLTDDHDFRIYELKSGSPPLAGKVRAEHSAQLMCYSMIAEWVLKKRVSLSAVFYSAAGYPDPPIRQVKSNIYYRQNLLRGRNELADAFRRLAEKDFSPFIGLLEIDSERIGMFDRAAFLTLKQAYEQALPEIKAYFEEFICFTAAEHRLSKLGGNSEKTQNGFSGLWKDTLADKKENLAILYGYSICFNHPDTDLVSGHLFMEPKYESAFTGANFREGDIIVLYPVNPETEILTPTKNLILRGYIKELHDNGLLISLRNKQVSDDFFVISTHWAVEHDYMESGYLKMYESLAYFLTHHHLRKKLLILGKERPTFGDNLYEAPEIEGRTLSPKQNYIFQKALNAKDYFLIQGPPGTGKTSTLLRSIAEYLYKNTDEKLLFLAFTNRASDEISEKLKEAGIHFFRLGSSGVQQVDALRSEHIRNKDFDELMDYFDSVRVFVSTVASYLSTKNYLTDIKFDTVIVDEASQLLEPHLAGILADSGRFLLIGDEKQLPAVVLQDTENERLKPGEHLQACGFTSYATSLFERLLINCQKNGWNDAYDRLTDHFRMHADIADFISREYYENQLTAFSPKQKVPLNLFSPDSEDETERQLASGRLIFIDIPASGSGSAKQSILEAEYIRRIFEMILRRLLNRYEYDLSFLPELSVGIITPFRAQIALIRSRLPSMMKVGSRSVYDLQREITVDTVERFQGSERDFILVSLAVRDAYLASHLCSLSDDRSTDRKLNVMLSRAKEQVVICGDAKMLSILPSYLRLIEECKERTTFFSFR